MGFNFDPHHKRSHARTVAKMLSLGVVSEEKAKEILERAYEWAYAAQTAREFNAAMGVILAAAKLEMEREKLDKGIPDEGDQHLHLHVNVIDRISEYRRALAESHTNGQGSHPLRNGDGQPVLPPETNGKAD